MDLALSLGQSVGSLSRTMSEREFMRWQKYSAKRLLPWQRMEWYLAQMTRWIAMTMGGLSDARLQDFLMPMRDPEEDEMDDEETLQEAIVAFQFSPVNAKE